MSTDLTLLYTGASGEASASARICANSASRLGVSHRLTGISDFSTEELFCDRTLIFFLGATSGGWPPLDAIPFWLHLNSLNPGSLKNLHFAVYALGDSGQDQFCAFGNACNMLLGRLGAFRLHPLTTCDQNGELCPDKWILSVLAKRTPSRSSRLEALAA